MPSFKLFLEEKQTTSVIKNKNLLDALKSANKEKALNAVLSSIHGAPEATKAYLNLLNSLSEEESVEFAQILQSKKSIPSTIPASELEQKIIDIEVKGTGKGEVWLATILKGAEVQGGYGTYDISWNKGKYEVKYYAGYGPGTPIRLGTASEVSATNFDFFKNTMKLVETLKEIYNDKSFIQYFENKEELRKLIVALASLPSNSINTEQMQQLKSFYELANKNLEDKKNVVQTVEFKGSSIDPIKKSIVPISKDKIESSSKVKISFTEDTEFTKIERLMSTLSNHPYVKDPAQFEKDTKDAANSAFSDVTIILFRKNGDIKQVKELDLIKVSQGRMFVMETD